MQFIHPFSLSCLQNVARDAIVKHSLNFKTEGSDRGSGRTISSIILCTVEGARMNISHLKKPREAIPNVAISHGTREREKKRESPVVILLGGVRCPRLSSSLMTRFLTSRWKRGSKKNLCLAVQDFARTVFPARPNPSGHYQSTFPHPKHLTAQLNSNGPASTEPLTFGKPIII